MYSLSKPNIKITSLDEKKNTGKFEISPLERGFGLTIGNSLRRVLLAALPGKAIKAIRIEGIKHEFSVIENVLDDVPNIILNLKEVALDFSGDEEKLTIDVGAGIVTAADIKGNVKIKNPSQYITTVSEGGSLKIDLIATTGSGYVESEENIDAELPVGFIAIDSLFSPVKKVSYKVEKVRVNTKSDYDKLIMNIDTNEIISPKEAISLASNVLEKHFEIISGFSKLTLEEDFLVEQKVQVITDNIYENNSISTLNISNKVFNALKQNEITTIGELLAFGSEKVKEIKHFGEKSYTELEQALAEIDLKLQ